MTARLAALPMYDADRAAVERWWRALAQIFATQGLTGVPARIDWPADLDAHWRDPDLLVSQTCGYPLVADLRGVVQVIGAFRYTAPGCAGIDYRSELVVRDAARDFSLEDLRGGIAAVNGTDSHSGYHALRGVVAPLARERRFFREWLVSGSHRRSLELVRDGQADVAAIDCVTLAGLQRLRPRILAGLAVIGSLPPAPGLPLVTAAGTSAGDLSRLRRSLSYACLDPALAPLREALFIGGFEVVDSTAWRPIEAVHLSAHELD